MAILAQLYLAKIRTMDQPNLHNMPQKCNRKVDQE